MARTTVTAAETRTTTMTAQATCPMDELSSLGMHVVLLGAIRSMGSRRATIIQEAAVASAWGLLSVG